MTIKTKLALFAGLLGCAVASPSYAHVTIGTRETPVGTFYKAVFTVPHGCDGASTVKIAVQIPEGVISVKPMVKPGWALEVKRGDYSKPYAYLHGAKMTQGAKEISWSGGNIPDAYFDEFVLQTFIAGELAPGTTLYFPVVQTCEKGETRWDEIPSGKPDEKLGKPAPALKLTPAATKAH